MNSDVWGGQPSHDVVLVCFKHQVFNIFFLYYSNSCFLGIASCKSGRKIKQVSKGQCSKYTHYILSKI